MQVFLEPDEQKVLPIPYWTEGEPERRFWNVKRDPAVAARIGELSGCPELRDFVVRVNRPASRFATLGCAHWVKSSGHEAFTHEAGLYADLVLDRFETAARRRSSIDFFERLRARGAEVADRPGQTIIRVQPQRVAFAPLGPQTAWMLSTWVFGAGVSEAEAVVARRRGLVELEAVCEAVGLEISARDGDGGTRIP